MTFILLFIVTIYSTPSVVKSVWLCLCASLMICCSVFLPFSSYVEKKSSSAGSRLLHRGGNSIYFLQGDLEQVSCCSVCVRMLCAGSEYAVRLPHYTSSHISVFPLTSVASFRIFLRRSNRGSGSNVNSGDNSDTGAWTVGAQAPETGTPHTGTTGTQEIQTTQPSTWGTQANPTRSTRKQTTRTITRTRRTEGKRCLSPVTTAAYKRDQFKAHFSLLSSSKQSVCFCLQPDQCAAFL